jgi:hypothetical protein
VTNKILYLTGCSFTHNLNGLYLEAREYIENNFTYKNFAFGSRSNFQILSDIKEMEANSVAIIQWSALTRPNGMIEYEIDYNKDLNEQLEKAENPLYFLIETFIEVVTEATIILEQKNIKHFQYIGWNQWYDHEINEDLRDKLSKLPITWFTSKKTLDLIIDNCWSLIQRATTTSEYGIYEWDDIVWGGMAEWIRDNVSDPRLRYVSTEKYDNFMDPHPSQYAGNLFYTEVIIPRIHELYTV